MRSSDRAAKTAIGITGGRPARCRLSARTPTSKTAAPSPTAASCAAPPAPCDAAAAPNALRMTSVTRCDVSTLPAHTAASAAGDIFAAVKRDSMEDIKAALAADPSALDRTGPGGQSPLMHAVLMGKGAAAKYLLKRGADVSVAEKDGYTPMHGAGFQGLSLIHI